MKKLTKPSLLRTHPKLAVEALDWNPRVKNAASRAQVRWRCPKGHHYSESILNRVINNAGCNFCVIEESRTRKIPAKNFRSLRSTHPKIAPEAAGWDPNTVSAKSKSWALWFCSKGHHYEMQIDKRVLDGENCPHCEIRVKKVEKRTYVRKNPETPRRYKPPASNNHTIPVIQWSEKCSSCGMLFNPAAPHECRDY